MYLCGLILFDPIIFWSNRYIITLKIYNGRVNEMLACKITCEHFV